MENIIQQEELIQKYLAQDNKEAAMKLLFELVTACAREKNFRAAESLRDRMFEIDPMALTEIIRSGEIIEEEKSDAIDREHREIWSRLYEQLTVEEANALYFALKSARFKAEEAIYSQGEWKPQLFFLNSGRAKIVYFREGREVLLKLLNAGQVAGEDTFFTSTICTTSLIAVSSVELNYLDAGVLKAWKKDFPVLESKLQAFASKGEKIKDLLQARELDRRSFKRITTGGKGTVNLMSPSGNLLGKPFKVEVCDVSRGGMCLLVRITKRETASLLLGQRLSIGYLNPQMDLSKTINAKGTVVAVRFHPFEDCTINVKFDDLLPERLINEFERLGPPVVEFDF